MGYLTLTFRYQFMLFKQCWNICWSISIWSPSCSFSSYTFIDNNKITNWWTPFTFVLSSLNPLFPAWNSLESSTQISLPLSLNNRFATELYSLSRAESLTQVSDVDVYWLWACARRRERKGFQLHIVITQAVFLMYPQTDLGQWKWENAIRSMWLFHPAGVDVCCMNSV